MMVFNKYMRVGIFPFALLIMSTDGTPKCQYKPNGPNSIGKECVAGFFCPDDKTISPCPPGTYCPPGSCNSNPCKCGHQCPARATSQMPCPATFYCPNSTLTVPCPAGHYCPPASCKPTPCECGYKCPPGATARIACQPPFYCPGLGNLNQTLCPIGHKCDVPAMCAPKPCPPGTFVTCAGKQSCQCCSPGRYCPTPTTTFVCPPGSYCPPCASAPTPCPLGLLCHLGFSAPAAV